METPKRNRDSEGIDMTKANVLPEFTDDQLRYHVAKGAWPTRELAAGSYEAWVRAIEAAFEAAE